MQATLNLARRDFHKLGLLSLLAGLAGCEVRAEQAPPIVELRLVGDLRLANNQFAINFLQNIEENQPDKNQIVSPFSIESALLMAMEGARNQTADEMGIALALPDKLKQSDEQSPWNLESIRLDMKGLVQQLSRRDTSAEQKVRSQLADLRAELNRANNEANRLARASNFAASNRASQKAKVLADRINQLAAKVDQYDLQVANGIWTEISTPVSSEFINRVAKDYHAAIQNVDFKSAAEKQRLSINQWVSDQTQQKINDLLPPGTIQSMTRMVLANAIYFRGTWQEPFDESQTQQKDFLNHGTSKSKVNMMSKWCGSSRYAAFNLDGSPFATPRTLPGDASPRQGYPSDGYQVAELAYNGGDISMIVVLPSKPTGLAATIDSLTSEQVDRWEETLEVRDFQLQLPKFKMEVTYDLNKALTQLGMKAAFDSNMADFSGMGAEQLFISQVFHKAFVEVTEKGTEAAAATAVIMETTSALPREIPFIPQFNADHPFLFLIKHRPSGLILFLDKVESL